MSLYITTNTEEEELNLHIGSGPMRDHVEPCHVIWIQADGDELDAIREKFGVAALIPKGESVVRWYGDTAKFIIGNL